MPPTPPSMPSLTIDQLLASPDSLLVDGMKLSATVALYRDFFPESPPEGRPMVAFTTLNGSPPGSWPASVSDVYIWVIRDSSEVWRSTMSPYLILADGRHIYTARDGPLWDPAILVNVVVGVRSSATKVSLALFPNVPIMKTS